MTPSWYKMHASDGTGRGSVLLNLIAWHKYVLPLNRVRIVKISLPAPPMAKEIYNPNIYVCWLGSVNQQLTSSGIGDWVNACSFVIKTTNVTSIPPNNMCSRVIHIPIVRSLSQMTHVRNDKMTSVRKNPNTVKASRFKKKRGKCY